MHTRNLQNVALESKSISNSSRRSPHYPGPVQFDIRIFRLGYGLGVSWRNRRARSKFPSEASPSATMKPNSFKILLATAIFTACCSVATPLDHKLSQIPFKLGGQVPQAPHRSADGRGPAFKNALKALSQASSQVIETFETVMAELSDVSRHLTWSLPRKVVTPRLDGWDHTVSSAALPEHSLRVKQPNSLGVDDVKQVRSLFSGTVRPF